jgi:signal transduction histidine kinase/ActR/RegA family two-component response regulator
MASSLEEVERHLDEVVRVIAAVTTGDLSQRVGPGPAAAAVNGLIERLKLVTGETIRATREMAVDGALGGAAGLAGLPGVWGELAGSVDGLLAAVTGNVRGLMQVTRAVARGDLSRRLEVVGRGEMLALAQTINQMADQLEAFGARVAEVAKALDVQRGPGPARDGVEPRAGQGDVLGVWKELTESVNLADQVAQLSRYRGQFLANVSHELRTPLNSMLVLARLLSENKDGTLTARQLEYAATIYSAGTDLLTLINEILDLSKLEAGKMRVELQDVDLLEIAGAMARSFRAIAEQTGVSLAVSVAPGTPARIRTDRQRLRQILQNLLSNAFKFTERGEVALRIAAAGSDAVTFSVRDSGIGIPVDQQQLVFEPFQQGDASTSLKYGGTGLGLSISRAFAERLGGQLRVQSAPAAGSTFTLLLPRQLAEQPTAAGDLAVAGEWIAPVTPAPSTGPDELRARLAGRRALVIDDDVRNIFALASVLESQEMKTLFAESGRGGVDALAHSPDVDVVLIDLMMPDMDGHQTIAAIRADPRHAVLPILAVTARAQPDDRERALAAGASAYLTKPIDGARLLTVIAGLLARA